MGGSNFNLGGGDESKISSVLALWPLGAIVAIRVAVPYLAKRLAPLLGQSVQFSALEDQKKPIR